MLTQNDDVQLHYFDMSVIFEMMCTTFITFSLQSLGPKNYVQQARKKKKGFQKEYLTTNSFPGEEVIDRVLIQHDPAIVRIHEQPRSRCAMAGLCV